LGLSEDNDQYAWRPLEISERIQSLPTTLALFIDSPNFTPGFLMEFLKSYHQQADYIPKHYSAIGNHLLFEGERIIKAGCVFPEFKEADFWRKSGIKVLNNEIQKQVFEDGVQFELSPSYHNASINIFLRALSYTQSVELDSEFPDSYKLTVEKMILATINFSFPDYSFPMFGDAWLNNKSNMIKLFTNWSRSFPNNPIITYFASDCKEGIKPGYLSKPLRNGGFYTFRNGWDSDATVMVVKAGPKGFFHAQPDNGTFELWVKGRNFMPDAGCYVYSGDEQIMKMRDWFRQTKVHQTLTLDNKNMETTDANLLKWETSATQDLLSYENQSYSNLKHIRSIVFVDKTFFVIVDRAVGLENGTVGIHFQLVENSKPVIKNPERKIYTQFADGNNLIIQNLDPDVVPTLVTEEGKVSYKYREEIPRPAFAFEKAKQQESIEFISVVLPFKGLKPPTIKLAKKQIKNGVTILSLIVNGKNYEVKL
jgi:heparan-sulfate lyase